MIGLAPEASGRAATLGRRIAPTSVGREVAMKSVKCSVKHARYAMGSLTAVLFALCAHAS